jgi:hypothetical protein
MIFEIKALHDNICHLPLYEVNLMKIITDFFNGPSEKDKQRKRKLTRQLEKELEYCRINERACNWLYYKFPEQNEPTTRLWTKSDKKFHDYGFNLTQLECLRHPECIKNANKYDTDQIDSRSFTIFNYLPNGDPLFYTDDDYKLRLHDVGCHGRHLSIAKAIGRINKNKQNKKKRNKKKKKSNNTEIKKYNVKLEKLKLKYISDEYNSEDEE